MTNWEPGSNIELVSAHGLLLGCILGAICWTLIAAIVLLVAQVVG